MDSAIEATGLVKAYGKVPVLAGIDLAVTAGSVHALLGPNGAGKTTTVRILATLVRPDRGIARVAGFDVMREAPSVRRRISLTGQYAAVDDLQTGSENLIMMARLAGLGRSAAKVRSIELLEQFDLVEAGHRRVVTYSGGMRRRLDLAASLVVAPAVLFLDEPTTGLDPRSRHATWAAIADLARAGVTILLTTQYLEEADRLASRIAVIDGGRIVASGTPAELKARVGGHRLELTMATPTGYEVALRILGERVVRPDPTRLTMGVPFEGGAATARALLDQIDPDRTAVADFSVHTATLDDVFLTLTGHTSTAQAAAAPTATAQPATATATPTATATATATNRKETDDV